MHLYDTLDKLKGFGEKRVQILKENNIETLEDLINFIPYKYENRSKILPFGTEVEHNYTFIAKVTSKPKIKYIRYKFNLMVFEIEGQNGLKGEVVFFNQPYLSNQFKLDQEYYFFGLPKKEKNKYKIYSPKFAPIEDKSFLNIIPIYKKLEKIPQSVIINGIKNILSNFTLKDFLPEKYRAKYNILSQHEMFESLHFPKDNKSLKEAKKRIKLNEALKINTGIRTANTYNQTSDIIINNFQTINPLIKNLPFELTHAQELVLRDIFRDLESGKLMNRMIEGDVGSGKTILAIICAYLFTLNGLQTAYMAPTEILAKQHFKTFKEIFDEFNIRIELLTGSQKDSESSIIRKKIKNGEVDIVIGTHSLFQEKTDFYNLGLVITDEQHRFGVKQRGLLERKGNAHTLVMSATPIPRSLALTLYGDLDLSIIDELPKGRKKVKTYFYTFKKIKEILNFTKNQIDMGHQAFIVCPYIEDSEENKDVISVTKAYDQIKKFYKNTDIKIGYLHSKLSEDEKNKIITDFNKNNIDLLIATSIIEVGINVPNVSTIVILNSDRFGLAQLHQLRGRTGRSNFQSYCFLVSNNQSETTIERMKIIVNNHNGREIAEEDLKLRGPGEYFGYSQHGYGNIKLINPLKDKKLFEFSSKLLNRIFTSPEKEDLICKDYLIKTFNKELENITFN